MENEIECLADKEDQDRHFAEEFVKNIVPSPSYRDFRNAICLSLLGNAVKYVAFSENVRVRKRISR